MKSLRPEENPGPEASDDYEGGKWLFSINGQVNPNIPMTSPGGELWRITNASGSVTYNLNLFNPAQKRNMLMQVISLDGVSVSSGPNMTPSQMTELGGGKFVAEACPVAFAVQLLEQPLCTRELHLMPSARAEIWVVYRDSKDMPAVPPTGASAILSDPGYTTGPSGDSWPAINLASVQFEPASHIPVPSTLFVNGEAAGMVNFKAISTDLVAQNSAIKPEKPAACYRPGILAASSTACPPLTWMLSVLLKKSSIRMAKSSALPPLT